jgi:filamentous hemagglutinin family protein
MTSISNIKVKNKIQKNTSNTRLMVTSAIVAASMVSASLPAYALDLELPVFNPIPANIPVGAASITVNGAGDKMNIVQSTDRVVINWNSFNIGADATVQFYQPDVNSLAVNKVSDDGQFSRIDGKLKANGKLIILDPNGIIFGANSITNVGSIIASTGDIDNNQIDSTATILDIISLQDASVENHGRINASDSGLTALIAPTVKNSGVIKATLGKVALASGRSTATVDLYGDGLVELALLDEAGKTKVENSGTVKGKTVLMTASAAKKIVDGVVNTSHVRNASTAKVVGNKIILSADKVRIAKGATIKGATDVKANTVKLGATIDGVVTGAAGTVFVTNDTAKINQAMDIISESGTINVAAGTYYESVAVDKKGVILKGANVGVKGYETRTAETIINPNSPGFLVTADNVTIDGFTIADATGADGYGIFVNNADNAVLKNNIIRDVSQQGVRVIGAIDVSIVGNDIYRTGNEGVFLNNVSKSLDGAISIADNYVHKTGSHGIHVRYSNNTSISGNKIGSVREEAQIKGDGVRLFYSSGSIIDNNTISNINSEAFGFGSGVNSFSNDDVSITNNMISKTSWDGVKVTSGNNFFIDNNNMTNIARSGVAIDMTSDSTVSNNIMDGLKEWGIWSRNNTNILFKNNWIFNVTGAGHGIHSRYDSNIYMDGNRVNGANGHGIYVQDSYGRVDIVNKHIIVNAVNNGIFVENHTPYSKMMLVRNDAPTEETPESGVFIIGNLITNSGNNGVYVVNTNGTIKINSNEISNSRNNGVHVTGFDDEDFYFGPARKMVYNPYEWSVNLEVVGNKIYNSQSNGVLVDGVNSRSVYFPPEDDYYGEGYESESQIAYLGDDYPIMPSTGYINISSNEIANSLSNGIGLFNVGGTVDVTNNEIYNSGSNGLLVQNFSRLGFPIMVSMMDEVGEGLYPPIYGFYRQPIDILVSGNTIENNGYVDNIYDTDLPSVSAFDSLDLVEFNEGDEIIEEEGPYGFAAINLNLGADGYADITNNTLGGDFEYGLFATSGEIDLTNGGNIISDTNIGMGFYAGYGKGYIPRIPSINLVQEDGDGDSYVDMEQEYLNFLGSVLKLTDNTIGNTVFNNQSELFVDLGYGSFYAPGLPTLLNGLNATYNADGFLIAPSVSGGVTQEQADYLETKFNHFVDFEDRGLFAFPLVEPNSPINQEDIFRIFGFGFNSGTPGQLIITGLPGVVGQGGQGGFNPNAIEPAAGGEGEEEASNNQPLNEIQPSAGGNDVGCWSDAFQSLGQGGSVSFSYGSTPDELLNAAANCGS